MCLSSCAQVQLYSLHWIIRGLFRCSVQMLAAPFHPKCHAGWCSSKNKEKQESCSCKTLWLTWYSAQTQQSLSPGKRRGSSGSWRTWPGCKQTLGKEKAAVSPQSTGSLPCSSQHHLLITPSPKQLSRPTCFLQEEMPRTFCEVSPRFLCPHC